MIKGIMRNFIIIVILNFIMTSLAAMETCSRTAVINYQEVLVDTNSNQKGEGLRYYLEKDLVARDYLDKYQDGTRLKWYQAIPGSVGTGLTLVGILSPGDNNRRSLIIGGITLILVNFLVAKTLEAANEENLQKSIEEYNKRNLPIIHFNQGKDQNRSGDEFLPSILINYSRTF